LSDIRPTTHPVVTLEDKINDRSARVGIVGIGYVGMPTMVAVANGGFGVTGIDVDEGRVDQVNRGQSYIADVSGDVLSGLVQDKKISATVDFSVVKDLDVIIVCVPTPITKHKEPDLTAMNGAIENIAANMRKGQLILLQSTTFPGTTEELALPMLQESGLQLGNDFYLAFALERIDPGNPNLQVHNVPKVVGGITAECTRIATSFLSTFIREVVPVSSPRIAEMTKLLENTFRSVNIALVNELAMVCQRMDIDIWEVIDAASTKPVGYMPFYPGPGVGGHCIPVDPFYLSWKAKEHDFYVNFIELAARINDNMPYYNVSRIVDILSENGRAIKDANLLLLGLTFKENISDTRNSPAIKIMELLESKGAAVAYSDYNVPEMEINRRLLTSVELTPEVISRYDAVITLVVHREFDLAMIVDNAKILIDTKNAAGHLGPRENVVRV
jgi:UDP-N-acetyl-D-glucosamine dehydrogenase